VWSDRDGQAISAREGEQRNKRLAWRGGAKRNAVCELKQVIECLAHWAGKGGEERGGRDVRPKPLGLKGRDMEGMITSHENETMILSGPWGANAQAGGRGADWRCDAQFPRALVVTGQRTGLLMGSAARRCCCLQQGGRSVWRINEKVPCYPSRGSARGIDCPVIPQAFLIEQAGARP
jgi:hypothetical protein